MGKYDQNVEFRLEGRFVGFAIEEGYKLKALRLTTSAGEYVVKLPKELRPLLYRTLVPGAWIQVTGYQKVNPLKGTCKLKAQQVIPIAATAPTETASQTRSIAVNAPVQHSVPADRVASMSSSALASLPNPCTNSNSGTKKRRSQDTILVCQKSDCCKRGANALMRALQTELNDRGLDQQVAVRGTGCMKQCKAGPALVMPDKSRYTRLRPDQAAALVDKHFPETKEMAS